MKLQDRIRNAPILDKWPEIVGANIARHAHATGIDDENLYVSVDNPVWQGQLFLIKNKIIEKLKTCGVEIKDVKFSIM